MSTSTTRNAHLRDMLLGRRSALEDDVRRRIRDGRSDGPNDVGDETERSDASISEEIEFALLHMKTETLRRIEEALGRLDSGQYGRCFQCEADIAATRLRALPFAVRRKPCEERREQGQARSRGLALQHAGLSLFSDVVS
jgi:DnaK suppressor protein